MLAQLRLLPSTPRVGSALISLRAMSSAGAGGALAAATSLPASVGSARVIARGPRGLGQSRVTVDLAALRANIAHFQKHVGDAATVVPVIKADAYSHGAVQVALMAEHVPGVRMLAVAGMPEAAQLRDGGVKLPVLVMGHVLPEEAVEAAHLGVAVVVYDADIVVQYGEALAAAGSVPALAVVEKVDTGMHRIGVRIDDACDLMRLLRTGPHAHLFDVVGAMTHFACADEDAACMARQLDRWRSLLPELEAAGATAAEPAFELKWKHCANSAAAMLRHVPKYAEGNVARLGIAMYGSFTSDVAEAVEAGHKGALRWALTWSTRVVQVKALEPGASTGYGCTYTNKTDADERVAVLPIGYADGYRRLVNNGCVLIHGTRCPVRGRVSMEKTVVSIAHLPVGAVRVGDEVVLLGAQPHPDAVRDGDGGGDEDGDGATAREERITADEVAQWQGTISYEVFTNIARATYTWVDSDERAEPA